MVEYFSIKTSARENEANRIAADMRFSFIDGPKNNTGLLKSFKQLVLAANDNGLMHYFSKYFSYYEKDFDTPNYETLNDSDEIVIDDMKNRIENYLRPERQRKRQQIERLGIPKDKTSAPISVKIMTKPIKPVENE